VEVFSTMIYFGSCTDRTCTHFRKRSGLYSYRSSPHVIIIIKTYKNQNL